MHGCLLVPPDGIGTEASRTPPPECKGGTHPRHYSKVSLRDQNQVLKQKRNECMERNSPASKRFQTRTLMTVNFFALNFNEYYCSIGQTQNITLVRPSKFKLTEQCFVSLPTSMHLNANTLLCSIYQLCPKSKIFYFNKSTNYA